MIVITQTTLCRMGCILKLVVYENKSTIDYNYHALNYLCVMVVDNMQFKRRDSALG